MMPGLDGFGLLRALRSDPHTALLPIVLLSARAGEEAKVEGLEAGADDYLVKTFAARELLARVDAHLALGRARDAASRREQAARAEAAPRRCAPGPGRGAGCGLAARESRARRGRSRTSTTAPGLHAGAGGDLLAAWPRAQVRACESAVPASCGQAG